MSKRIRVGDEPSFEKMRHHAYARWTHATGNKHVPIVGMFAGVVRGILLRDVLRGGIAR